MQNIPANGKTEAKDELAKMVKKCFKAPPGFFLVGADFSSLEDKISALTTRDPEKLKIYTDGYDGHCLRAYSYFGDQMPGIDPTTVKGINSIKKLFPSFRQESKTPTFLLTYMGTWMGIMEQLGWTEEKAKRIEARYHDLYRVSDEWVAARIAEAGQVGYVTCAFGLKVRTPLLEQVIRGNSKTPWEAEAEGRTAGNALGQSWGLLNNRAGVEFMGKVRKSKYRLKIRPCAHIHDAQYYMIPDEIPVLLYTNEHLINAMKWQNDLLIYHPTVKLGGDLSVFFPSWAAGMSIPNDATADMIPALAEEHFAEHA
jgi:DNA polymerase-1